MAIHTSKILVNASREHEHITHITLLNGMENYLVC